MSIDICTSGDGMGWEEFFVAMGVSGDETGDVWGWGWMGWV